MKLLRIAGLIGALAIARPGLAQGFRYDQRVTTVASNVPLGASAPVYAISKANIKVCPTAACASLSTIYLDQALTVPTSSQFATDTQGRFGFWAAAGTYYYQVSTTRGIIGTYAVTLGGSGGGGSGSVTNVSGGSPLFSIANPTTTPALNLLNAAAHTVFGNNTGGSAAPGFFSLTYGDISGSMPLFGASNSGAVPASGGGTNNFLRADGAWVPAGGGGGATFPGTPGIVYNTSGLGSRNATFSDVVSIFGGGACSGFLKSDGTCTPIGGVSGLTLNHIPLASSSTSLADSHLDDGFTTPGVITSTLPIAINAPGNGITALEGTAPSGVATKDVLYPDSTAHRWKMNNNNAGALNLVGLSTAATPGHTAVFAANGIDVADGGGGGVPNSPTSLGSMYTFGDSTFAANPGSGPTSTDVGAIGTLSSDFPYATYNYAIGGTDMVGIVNQYFVKFPAGNTATTRIPTIVSNGGINDANNLGVNGVNNYSLALNAGVAWVLTPTTLKVMASTATTTGSWAATSSLMTLHASNIGTAMVSTTNASTLSFSVPSNNGRIGITWQVPQAASGGTFTVAIDGVNQTNTCSGSTTFTSTWCTGVAVDSNTAFRQDFAVSAGAHTVLVTVTSSTSGSNPVYILDVDTNPASKTGQPNFIMSGVLRQTADALASTTAAYNTAASTLVSTMAAENYNIVFADVRGGTPGVNTTTDMTNAVNAASPCQGGTAPLHPNNCGYLNYALTIENAAAAFPTRIFYPGFGLGRSKFGNQRIQGNLLVYGGQLQFAAATYAGSLSLTSGTAFVQTNANNSIDNTAAVIPNSGQFAPGTCFYQDCTGNMTAAALSYDTANSRFITSLLSTFSMGFQKCPANITTGPTACDTIFWSDPATGILTAKYGYVSPSLQLTTSTAGTCSASLRGQFQYTAGGAGVKDIVQVCAKDAADVYAWRTIY